MNIFNSLGSNYNFEFVLRSLLTQDQKNYSVELLSFLEKKFSGKAMLFYKGGEALRAVLEISGLPESAYIAINGFTCFAVYKAIVSAGFKAEYLDLEKEELNFSPKILLEKLKKNSQIRAVIVQNTLGYPCEISQIAKICKENNIILIEDLAHCVGAMYEGKNEAGTVGDFVILSFSQDKIVDGISGGALVARNKQSFSANKKYQSNSLTKPRALGMTEQLKDRLYPALTYMIRNTYNIQLGKVLHALSKRLNLLSKPIENENIVQARALPSWYCSLIKFRFEKLFSELLHRKRIATIYAKDLNKKVLSAKIVKQIPISSNLRFPIFVENRKNLIKYLKNNHIFVSDIWYDAPISPKKYLHLTNYKNQCPNAEIISKKILNLPTHQNISESRAKEVCKIINKWLKLQ